VKTEKVVLMEQNLKPYKH